MAEMQIEKSYITAETSNTIKVLRVYLIFLVIFIHYPIQQIEISGAYTIADIGNIVFYWVQTLMNRVISACAVPTFFVISGYLFFKGNIFSKQIYLNKIKSRIRSLLIPYIIWNLLALICILAIRIVAQGEQFHIKQYIDDIGIFNVFWDCQKWGEDNVNWLGIPIPWTGPINFPLWYARNLIVLVIISPIIFYIVKWLKFIAIIAFFIAFCSGIFINIPGINATSVFFFSLGAYLSVNKKDLILPFDRWKNILIPVFIGISCCYLCLIDSEIGTIVRPFFIVSYIPVTLIIARKSVMICKHISSIISKYSNTVFFIYALHILIIWVIQIFLPLKFNGFINTLFYLIGVISVFFICVVIFMALKSSAPKLLKYLNGNRV